jgi:small conductance mechanosensitive channel
MNELWQQFQANLPTSIGNLAGVAVILLAGWLFYRYFITSFQQMLVRVGVSPGVVSFLCNTIRAMILCAVGLAVLRQIGIETTSLLALLGAAGAALAISLQGFMGNFASGLVLLSERMMRLGDTIEVADVRGQVVEMQTLHVVIETADRVRITIPNATILNNPFRNHSALPTRRVQWLLPLPAGVDLAPVKAALTDCLLADARVLRSPGPTVFLRDWAMDKQTLTVQAWTSTAEAQTVQDQLLEPLGKTAERFLPAASEKAAPPSGI